MGSHQDPVCRMVPPGFQMEPALTVRCMSLRRCLRSSWLLLQTNITDIMSSRNTSNELDEMGVTSQTVNKEQ